MSKTIKLMEAVKINLKEAATKGNDFESGEELVKYCLYLYKDGDFNCSTGADRPGETEWYGKGLNAFMKSGIVEDEILENLSYFDDTSKSFTLDDLKKMVRKKDSDGSWHYYLDDKLVDVNEPTVLYFDLKDNPGAYWYADKDWNDTGDWQACEICDNVDELYGCLKMNNVGEDYEALALGGITKKEAAALSIWTDDADGVEYNEPSRLTHLLGDGSEEE